MHVSCGKKTLTITFDHKRFDHIVTDHLKIGMTEPVADSGLGSRKKVVENGDIVSKKHQSVDKMGPNESSTSGYQYALASRGRKQLDRREGSEGSVWNRVCVWVVNRLALMSSEALCEVSMYILRFGFFQRSGWRKFILFCDVVGPQIKRTQNIDWDFTVESKFVRSNGRDILAALVESANLSREFNSLPEDEKRWLTLGMAKVQEKGEEWKVALGIQRFYNQCLARSFFFNSPFQLPIMLKLLKN